MLICIMLYDWLTTGIWNCYLNCFRKLTLNCIKVLNIALAAYISSFLLLHILPQNSTPFTVFSPSRTVNMNSKIVHLYSELFRWSLPTLICCTSILLLLTTHLVFVSMFMFLVYSMFYQDGICLSCVSCNKSFTYLLRYNHFYHTMFTNNSLSCS